MQSVYNWLFPYTSGAVRLDQHNPPQPQQVLNVVDKWRRDNQDEISRFGFYLMVLQAVVLARDNTSLFAVFLLAYFLWLRRNIN